MSRHVPLAGLLLVAVALPAADYVDVRLLGGSAPGIAGARDHDADDTIDIDSRLGGTMSLHVVYVNAVPGRIGWCVGGGPFVRAHDGRNDAGDEVRVGAAGLEATGGMVFRPTHRFHLEAPAATISLGGSRVEVEGDETGDGGYGAADVHAGAYYSFAEKGVQLGAVFGIGLFSASTEDDATDHDITFYGAEPWLQLALGWRF